MATSHSQGVPLGFEPAQNGASQLPVKDGNLPPTDVLPQDGQPPVMPSAPPGYENATFDESEFQLLFNVITIETK